MECSICLEPIFFNGITLVNCKHSFHKKCINKWLSLKDSCPLCRKQVLTIFTVKKINGFYKKDEDYKIRLLNEALLFFDIKNRNVSKYSIFSFKDMQRKRDKIIFKFYKKDRKETFKFKFRDKQNAFIFSSYIKNKYNLSESRY